jgi:hypothetical protein
MKKLPVILTVLMLTMLVGASRQVSAGSCISSAQCHNLCNEYCISKDSTCKSYIVNECNANGQQVCNVVCHSGSGYFPTCSCTSPGGSPIFKKQEIGPPPEPKKDGKQSSKTAQPAKADTGQCPGSKQPS